mmetsp:Transcript_9409/g.16483  ORF Transcript_9409/g.16483 Transcript_9409/m.16483 type:complete len:382 (+) Transcript_9409:484-1629(+)
MTWKCEVCTLENMDDNKKNCNLCGKPKGTPDPDAGNDSFQHMSLRAILKAGPDAFDSELQEVKRLQALKEIKGVFGVTLNTETPVVVCDCIAFLRAQGMYTEGLFRVPGQQDVVDALKHRYVEDREEDVLNSIPCEVHDVGTLLKSYFRWLPEPIVPKSSYNNLLNACRTSHSSKSELESAVFSAFAKLQSPNRECLSLLINFLREVAVFEKANKMTAVNLATCFAPSLMRAPDDVSPEEALMDMSAAIGVLVVLIRSDRKLFLPAKDQLKSSTRHKPKAMLAPPPGMGGEKEKRTSKKEKAASIVARTFRIGGGSKEDKRKSGQLNAPPGLGPPKPPPRSGKGGSGNGRSGSRTGNSGMPKKTLQKRNKVPADFNIDDKI